MRALLLLAALLLWSSEFAMGQTAAPSRSNTVQGERSEEATTAEAIAAIARGDYTRGAELLKPLLDPWAREFSQAAAFQLGQLYEKGAGVPRDPLRACALYGRASAGPAPVLAQTALELSFVQSEILGPSGVVDCWNAVNLGPDHGFAPATFTLGIDHWVTIELSSKTSTNVLANIFYRGQEKNVELNVSMGLATIFLPLQYTTLEMGAGTFPRHFIEAAAWVGGSQGKWSLNWSLTEIAEGDAMEAGSGELDVFEGLSPRDVVVNLRDFVTLRVNEFGKAEYAIVKGPNPVEAGIPDRREREEVASELARRAAAEKATDWKLRRDPGRAPSFRVVDAEGCGNVQLFAWTSDRTEAVVAFIDRELFELSASPRTIDLATARDGVRVFADVADRPRQSSYCSDVFAEGLGYRQETWQAVGGTLTIQVSPPGIRSQYPRQYRATIQIDNAVFRNTTGTVVRAPGPIRLDAIAGLMY